LSQGPPFAGFMRGAGHEGGRRAGTENTAQIVALGAACELAYQELESRRKHMASMRDRLVDHLRGNFPDLVVHGEGAGRLPNTACVAIPGADANTLLGELDGVAASAGAACHAGGAEPSAVLTSMGVDSETSLCTLRLTTGRTTTEAEIDTAAGRISAVAERLRGGK
ncbi:MAG: aminotransferase class V-fold PLP-dependent enzyme, partial [Deltaproteobacteria bacterium]|nr:aminotransferase class V-fold PLP-dependent enzyme [Deltaproteobacteria bacterium]